MQEEYFRKNDPGFQQSLTNLNLKECKELQGWLKGRIKYLNKIPHVKKKVDDLNLSFRAYNALKANDLNTVEDILRYGTDNLGLLRNVGTKTVAEIIQAVEGKTL